MSKTEDLPELPSSLEKNEQTINGCSMSTQSIIDRQRLKRVTRNVSASNLPMTGVIIPFTSNGQPMDCSESVFGNAIPVVGFPMSTSRGRGLPKMEKRDGKDSELSSRRT